jgi:hypothetical protein
MLSPVEDRTEAGASARRLPLRVTAPAGGANQPVTVGLPFPRGLLADPGHLRLLDPEGRPAPVQAAALARWADGSVKWALLDFVLGPCAAGEADWSLEVSPERPAPPNRPGLQAKEDGPALIVSTGPATFRLPRTGPRLIAQALVDGKEGAGPDGLRAILTGRKGRTVQPRVERFTLEAAGPVRATACLEGVFPGAGLRFVARLSFFAGTGLVRVAFTIHNPERARHRGGLWDLGDPGSVLFRDLSLRLGAQPDNKAFWTAEPGQTPRSASTVEIYQDSSGGENWKSRNHVNRDGRVPVSFRGYRVRGGDAEETGLRANPVVRVGGVAAAVPEFWQQFPKAIAAGRDEIRIGLFPAEFDDLHELQGGEQKTHVVWFDLRGAAEAEPLGWAHAPARVVAPPEWYADSGAVPYLIPKSRGEDRPVEAFLHGAIEGPNNLFDRREVIDEYGWRNYGDLYADHEAAYYTGPQPIISHYNNQYDVVYGGIVQYLRSGDPRWVELFDPLARHVTDIDIYHTDRDKAAYNGGLFWHTDHYRDAATCGHRAYSRANQPQGRPYGGGPCNEQNYTTGLLHYHYLTGDPGARDAVLSLADWVVAMDDGARNILGVVDDGPTGTASSTAERDYHGPGRGCGNSVNALLDAWLLTGRRAYLDKAESLIRRAVHPSDDVAGRDLLNVEARWSYTVFLSVLARYLHLKADAGELDRMYAYAQASLLRYAGWMAENEEPYFDRPEKLEFPTETWAAQEFRKANVMRLAAGHADEPLRSRLARRGDELARRAWEDLTTRFAHPATTRALAILLVEGMRDGYFHGKGMPEAPRAAPCREFGGPERFVGQRTRIRGAVKTPAGLVRTVFGLANIQRWRRLYRGG